MAGQVERLVTQAAASSESATSRYAGEDAQLCPVQEEAVGSDSSDTCNSIDAATTGKTGATSREDAPPNGSASASSMSPQLTVKVQAGKREPVYVDASWLEFSVIVSLVRQRILLWCAHLPPAAIANSRLFDLSKVSRISSYVNIPCVLPCRDVRV